MQTITQLFIDALVQVQDHPAALVGLVAFGAFFLSAFALYVVLAAIKRG